MLQIMEIFINGVAQGSVYCVFALGLSLVYGTARVLNFAHGSFYMTGSYLAWVLTAGYFGFGYPVMLLVLVPMLFGIGVLFEKVVIQPLRWKPNWKMTTMMVTLGLAFMLDNMNLIVFGPEDKLLPPLVSGTTGFLGLIISNHKIVVVVASLIVVGLLELFLHHTMTGNAIRAVSQDMQGAGMVGINVNRIFGWTFGISLVLAGLAGVLLAPIYLISPLGGWSPFLKAFVVVVFGGLGSTRGVLYAALILGVIESFVIYSLGATWTMPIWLLTLLVVLMVRPQGLLGVWAK